jgi:hypothetical protein
VSGDPGNLGGSHTVWGTRTVRRAALVTLGGANPVRLGLRARDRPGFRDARRESKMPRIPAARHCAGLFWSVSGIVPAIVEFGRWWGLISQRRLGCRPPLFPCGNLPRQSGSWGGHRPHLERSSPQSRAARPPSGPDGLPFEAFMEGQSNLNKQGPALLLLCAARARATDQ